MPKLINLAGKIKDTRKRLGMTQKEFIHEVSKLLNRTTPLNESLASQWESNLKNRASPDDKQIRAIASLTSRPWETMWWFMRDDIDHKRGYELYPNGQFTIAPPAMSPKQEEQFAAMAAEHKANYSEPIADELTAWMKDPNAMWSLYEPPKPEGMSNVQRFLGIAGLLPGTPCKNCGYKNHEYAISCANCKTAIDTGGLGEPGISGLEFSSGIITIKQVTSAQGSHEQLKTLSDDLSKDQKTFLNPKGLFAQRGPALASDFVDFPALPPSRLQTNENDSLEEAEIENINNFWSAVKFFASNDHFLSTEHFNQKIQTGALSQNVHYFDGDRAIQVVTFDRNSEIRNLRRSLQTKMMELCFVDRMKKRTSKKLILVSTFEKGLALNRLEKHLEELIHSSELLGIQVRFASGPLELAEGIHTFKTVKSSLD